MSEPGPFAVRLARLAFARGDRARDERRDHAAAARFYRLGLWLDPTQPAYWIQLGHMRKETGQLDAAERAYRSALALTPDDPDLHLSFGHLATVRGAEAEAREHYSRALLLGSDDPLVATGAHQRILAALARMGPEGEKEARFQALRERTKPDDSFARLVETAASL
ncbi:hypothetical protein B2G71_01115 [Novosphingobium sp. PC22D]|uniref:tetratricopeptide repeat protein n=1 Tax=Novosphingobium sp. PC22D TaxID=1962403 RepID=UPI000BEF2BF2|nr:tetratricopeptide repeat protein [Novosphingobium sp. PC22D]PEQ14238.1 hypothetical protein B2G71_01115 [Novosphingobium sp. PC22D]